MGNAAKWPGSQADDVDDSLLTSAEAKNRWSYASIPRKNVPSRRGPFYILQFH